MDENISLIIIAIQIILHVQVAKIPQLEVCSLHLVHSRVSTNQIVF